MFAKSSVRALIALAVVLAPVVLAGCESKTTPAPADPEVSNALQKAYPSGGNKAAK